MDQQSRGLLAHLALLGLALLALSVPVAVLVGRAIRGHLEEADRQESTGAQGLPVSLGSLERQVSKGLPVNRAPRAVRDRLESQGLWDQQAVTEYLGPPADQGSTSN